MSVVKGLSTLRTHWSLLSLLAVSLLVGFFNFEGSWVHRTYLEFRKYPHQERAQRLLSHGSLAEAEVELAKCLELDPEDRDVRTSFMILLYESGKYAEVIEQSVVLLQSPPASDTVLRYRAMAFKHLGNAREAGEDFLRAARLSGVSEPDRTFLFVSAVDIFLQEREYFRALQILRDLDQQTPTFAVEKRRAFALEQLGSYPEAVKSYESAVRLASGEDRFEAYKSLANAARKADEIETSRAALLGALSLRPNEPDLLRTLADLAYLEKNYVDAIHWTSQIPDPEKSLKDREFLIHLHSLSRDYSGAVKETEDTLAHASTDQDRQRLFVTAAVLHGQMHQYDQAAQCYRSALRISESAAVHAALARILQNLGEFSEAVRHLEEAVRLKPRAEFHYQLGMLYARSEHRERAIEQLTEALRRGLTGVFEGNAYEQLGYLYQSSGSRVQARDAFRKAKTALPDDPVVHTALGNSLMELGEAGPAIEVFQEQLNIRPDGATHFRLGMAYALSGDDLSAVLHIEEAIRQDLPTELSLEAFKQLGFLYSRLEKPRESRKAFLSALKQSPNDPEIYSGLGQAYIDLGSFEEAAHCFQKSASLRDRIDTWMALAEAQVRQGRPELALQTLQGRLESLENDPGSAVEVLKRIANLQIEVSQFSLAGSSFREAFQLGGGTDAQLLLQAATCFLEARSWENALQTCHQLMDMETLSDQERSRVFVGMAYAYSETKQHQAAIESYRKAIELGQDDWKIRQNLGIQLLETEDWRPAIENLYSSLSRKEDPLTRICLAQAYWRLGKPGVAVHFLQVAEERVDELDGDRQKMLYDSLGYMYAEEAEYAQAEAMFARSLQLRRDLVLEVKQARMAWLAGNLQGAASILEALASENLSPGSQVERLSTLAAIYEQWNQIPEAIEQLEEACSIQASAELFHRLGVLYQILDQNDRSIEYLERALLLDNSNATYLAALGYAYGGAGRLEEAVPLLEQALVLEPDLPAVYEDLGYLNMQLSDNQASERWFRRAIDEHLSQVPASSLEEKKLEEDTYRLRQEVSKLRDSFDFSSYLSYRTDQGPQRGTPIISGGGAIPAQGGVEVAYRLPGIGLRNERVFQFFGRVLWDLEKNSLRFAEETYQGGVGLRYKPLRSQNLFFGFEKLFRIGDAADDNFLLRSLFSWNSGYQRDPEHAPLNFTFLFGEAAYFLDQPRALALYGEFRQGFNVRLAGPLVMTPHLVIDGRYRNETSLTDSYLEGGGGLSFRYYFNENLYESYKSGLEFLIQGKGGFFFRQPQTAERTRFGGLVFSVLFHF